MTEYINVKSRNKKEEELFRIFKAEMKLKNISVTDSFITSMIFMIELCEKAEIIPEIQMCPKVSAIFERCNNLNKLPKIIKSGSP